MKRLLAALVLSATATLGPALAQDSAIVGMWRYVAQTLTEVQSGKVTKPFGEKPSGYLNFTKGGRLIFVLIGEGRQKPALPFKDEDRVRLFNTLSAGSGTYKVEGNTLTSTYDTSWHELWSGTTQTRTFKIESDTLTITSAPGKNAAGADVFFTIVLKKVE